MLKLKSVNFNHQLFESHHLTQSYMGQLEWLIGRDPRCDLVLKTLDVSRTHGRIFYDGSQYHFENISQHGSVYNNEDVIEQHRRSLHKGDILILGDTYLHVEEAQPPTFDPSALEPSASGEANPASSSIVLRTTKPDLSAPSKPSGYPSADMIIRCDRIIQETPDVKTFCFSAESGQSFDYQPGQFVNLQLSIEGQTILRPYSISSSPTRPHHLAVTIKRVASPSDSDLPVGLVSNWMHDCFQVGDRLTLKGGVFGQFTCAPDVPQKLLLLSAGSGITPMISMARWIQDTLAECDVLFLHSARTPADLIFRHELELMAQQMSNFRLALTVTRPEGNWTGLSGRITDRMVQLVAPDLQERTLFLCGSHDFRDGMRSLLKSLDFPMSAFHEESFGDRTSGLNHHNPSLPKQETVIATNLNITDLDELIPSGEGSATRNGKVTPLMQAKPEVSKQPQVQFAKSDVSIKATPDCTLLELAEQEGISIASACRAGICGACKVHTQKGNVRYSVSPAALTVAEQQSGYVLACIAYPENQVVIDA
jgi:glycine betaine catabolism B